MSAVALASTSNFSQRVMQVLERVDYRRAESEQDKEAIFRLRYEAYRREEMVPVNAMRRITDKYDDSAWIFGLYIDGELASSLRINVATKQAPELPGMQVFSDRLVPLLDAGNTIVDPTRFVADYPSTRRYPALAHLTVRLGWLAGDYFNADLILSTCRAEHQAFYGRVFGHRPVCEPRAYPTLSKLISLMVLDYPAMRERVHQRYPFYRSTFFERRMLFERHAEPSRVAA
jgi:N-acyl amino acid synthase FeeM